MHKITRKRNKYDVNVTLKTWQKIVIKCRFNDHRRKNPGWFIIVVRSGQSKGELGETEFPHLLFWAFVVPHLLFLVSVVPPPGFNC